MPAAGRRDITVIEPSPNMIKLANASDLPLT
jgi:hypothetical protein